MPRKDVEKLRAENADLRLQLGEAKDALRAIRAGEVDALVVQTHEGGRVFTLQNAYEPYRVFVEYMQQGAASLTAQGLVLYANRRFGEILGVAPDRVVGESIDDLIDASHQPIVEMLLAAQPSSPADGELTLQRGGGGTVNVLFHVTVMPDGTRCVVLTDISERLRQLELAEANRAKDEFLATLSHELRTPMNAIFGWAQMLAAGRLDTAVTRRAYDAILRNSQAQMQLITDILDVSRIVSGKLRLEIRSVDIIAVVYAAIDTVRPAAEAKDITLETVIAGDSLVLHGDTDRLQQIVWNLLSNAVKFTPQGGKIRVSLGKEGADLVIRVSDNGVGISPDLLPRVFDRFVQLDSSARRRNRGLGLGLSIVKRLVELHGGTAEAESEGAGRGATFTIRLPLAEHPLHRPERPALREPGAADAETSLDGIRILVVEDEVDARDMLTMLLTQQGAEVTSAASSAEGLGKLRAASFDLILADVGMPGEDGNAFIAKVRNLPSALGGGLPAIAVTAYGRPQDAELSLQSGFDLHLTKPVAGPTLAAAILRLARRPTARI